MQPNHGQPMTYPQVQSYGQPELGHQPPVQTFGAPPPPPFDSMQNHGYVASSQNYAQVNDSNIGYAQPAPPPPNNVQLFPQMQMQPMAGQVNFH